MAISLSGLRRNILDTLGFEPDEEEFDPTPRDMVTIIASAQPEGSAFTRMLSGRDLRTVKFPIDPRTRGMNIGTWVVAEDGEHLLARVTKIWDNGDADDWITGAPTEWYVQVERPWNQTSLNTTIGKAKIEWLEDTLTPRVGRVIECDPASNFMLGDIVRLG